LKEKGHGKEDKEGENEEDDKEEAEEDEEMAEEDEITTPSVYLTYEYEVGISLY